MRHLLGVTAAVGVGGGDDTSRDADTVFVATGVLNTGGGPDAPGTVDAIGAGNQAAAIKLEVAILDGPALTLPVAGSGLSTGGVPDLALA